MAQISPALDTLRHDAGRYRELDVLDRLQQSLPEGYEVFHSVAWQTAHHGEGRHGEIDLVVRDGDALVFVEVKTRSGVAFGHPFEAITPVKLARLRRLAGVWCEAHPRERGRIRIDAVAVLAPRGVEPRIEHLVGVF